MTTNLADGRPRPGRLHAGRLRPSETTLRHLLVVAFAAALVYGFALLHGQWSPMHRWNRALGDASLVLVTLAIGAGALSRLWRRLLWLLPFRRELGIYGTLAALAHTLVILSGWVEWDLLRLFGFEFHPQLGRYVMFQPGFGLANAIGFAALGFAIVLTATSNDLSLRALGASGWKFVQMGAVPLFWLTVAHVGYFLFAHFLSFHRQTPDPNPLQWPFVGLVLGVLGLRVAAFLVTARQRRAARGNPA